MLMVFTWRTILPNLKFHLDPIYNDGASGFFEEGRHSPQRKQQQQQQQDE